jgi:hypothetical protein
MGGGKFQSTGQAVDIKLQSKIVLRLDELLKIGFCDGLVRSLTRHGLSCLSRQRYGGSLSLTVTKKQATQQQGHTSSSPLRLFLVDTQAEQQDRSGRAGQNHEGIEMSLTPAQKYLASIYEQAVDLGLDVEAMRKYLLGRGVKRTPLQLEHELENLCGFYGYAAPPPSQASDEREGVGPGHRKRPNSGVRLSYLPGEAFPLLEWTEHFISNHRVTSLYDLKSSTFVTDDAVL